MNLGLQFKALGYSLARTFGPVTITDWYGIKMRLYPYEQTPIKKLITRENYHYEFAMYDKYAKGVVLDIGANIGIHSVYLSRKAEKVYAFEPVPKTLEKLKETAKINGAINIIPVGSGVGDANTTLPIQIFDDANSSWNSFHTPDSSVKPVGIVEVPVITLDSFAEKEGLKKIGFAKIDVEGHEMAVLKGATHLLQEKRIKVLSFEVTQIHTKNAEAIFSLLRSFGYSIDEYDPNRSHHNYYAIA